MVQLEIPHPRVEVSMNLAAYTEISLRSKLLPEYHNWLRQAQPTSPELVEGDTRQQRLWCEGQKVLFSFCSQYRLKLH